MVRIIDAKSAPAADCARCKYCNFYDGDDADCLEHGDVNRADVRADGCCDYSREDY